MKSVADEPGPGTIISEISGGLFPYKASKGVHLSDVW
jgi:hypothetical protein